MLMTMFGQEGLKHGAYSFMLMNFNLVKWRLASLKSLLCAIRKLYRAKRRHADAIKMVFDKDLFR
jgi:2-oxoglutarate dehydrogenase E1 component